MDTPIIGRGDRGGRSARPAGGRDLVERFRLERQASREGSTVIFDAVESATGRLVQIELVSGVSSAEARARFAHAASIAQRLGGDHVVAVQEAGTVSDGLLYMVREPVLTTLAAESATHGPIPVEQAVAWALEICEALAEAHALGIAHGDVRAETTYLARDPTGRVRAKLRWTVAVNERATVDDVARDVAGVASLLRRLLTGTTEAEQDGAKTLPSTLSYAVARGTTPDVSSRFRNVAELAAAIVDFAPPGHASARNIAFMLARAGVVSFTTPQPHARQTTSTMSGIGSNEDWFLSEGAAAAFGARPSVRRRRAAFAAVAILAIALAALVTLLLADDDRSLVGLARQRPAPAHVEPDPETGLTAEDVADTTAMTAPLALVDARAPREIEAPAPPTPSTVVAPTTPARSRKAARAADDWGKPTD